MEINKELLNRYNQFLLPLIAILASILIMVFLVVPNALKIPQTNNDIDTAKSTKDALDTKISQLDKVDLNSYQSDIDVAYNAIPVDTNIPALFGDILLMLQQNNLKLSDISFPSGSTTAKATLSTIAIKLGVIGSGDQVNAFINSLKSSPRIMKVEDISLTPSKGSPTLTAELEIDAFFQSPPAISTTIEQPVDLPSQTDFNTIDQIKQYIAQFPTVDQNVSNGAVGKVNPFQ